MLAGPVARPFRFDKRKPARIGAHPAHDEVHAIGKAETLTANLDERTVRHECAKPALERCPLLARNTKRPHEFLGGRGMIDAIADQAKDFLFSEH